MTAKSDEPYDIAARIELSTSVAEPKSRGVRTGYTPHHKFAKIGFLASGRHYYGDDQLHFPGEVLMAHIRFASWEIMGDCVNVDDRFEIRELDRVIGYGTVLSKHAR